MIVVFLIRNDSADHGGVATELKRGICRGEVYNFAGSVQGEQVRRDVGEDYRVARRGTDGCVAFGKRLESDE